MNVITKVIIFFLQFNSFYNIKRVNKNNKNDSDFNNHYFNNIFEILVNYRNFIKRWNFRFFNVVTLA